jgi:hypothetical protein
LFIVRCGGDDQYTAANEIGTRVNSARRLFARFMREREILA